MAKKPTSGPDSIRRKRVGASIGPVRRQTLFTVRRNRTGTFRQSTLGKGFDGKKETPLVPQAFQYRSVSRQYDIAKGGTRELGKELNRLVRHLGRNAHKIGYMALFETFELSQKYVPVETGALRKSGDLTIVERNGTKVAEITYARNGQPFYAVFVHEITEYSHLSPTKAKFLEVAVRQDMPNIEKRVAHYTRITLGTNRHGA